MARGSFNESLATVLRHEGGFVLHPVDPGGATKFGITRGTLARSRGGPVSVEDVRGLGRAEAGAIYRRLYWDTIRADQLRQAPTSRCSTLRSTRVRPAPCGCCRKSSAWRRTASSARSPWRRRTARTRRKPSGA